MIPVLYSAQALHDLERLSDFAQHDAPVNAIIDAVEVLTRHPFLGRPVRDEIRELVIAWGKRGYAALYRVRETSKHPGLRVEVLAIRHQREAGYR